MPDYYIPPVGGEGETGHLTFSQAVRDAILNIGPLLGGGGLRQYANSTELDAEGETTVGVFTSSNLGAYFGVASMNNVTGSAVIFTQGVSASGTDYLIQRAVLAKAPGTPYEQVTSVRVAWNGAWAAWALEPQLTSIDIPNLDAAEQGRIYRTSTYGNLGSALGVSELNGKTGSGFVQTSDSDGQLLHVSTTDGLTYLLERTKVGGVWSAWNIIYPSDSGGVSGDPGNLLTDGTDGLPLLVAEDLAVPVSINAQTGTSYAPVLADQGKFVTLTNSSPITVTLPSNATTAFPVGTQIDFQVRGVGMATFVAGSGATVDGTPSLVTRAQFSGVTIRKIGTDAWTVIGDLATP